MSLQYQAPPSQVIRREKETLRWCSEARPEPRLVSSGREGKRAKLFRVTSPEYALPMTASRTSNT